MVEKVVRNNRIFFDWTKICTQRLSALGFGLPSVLVFRTF